MSRNMPIFALVAAALAALLAPAADAGRGAAPCRGPACGGTLVLIGTQGSGPRQGIFAATLDPVTGALSALGLAAEAERPTWLEVDPERAILYAVSETGTDTVHQGAVSSLAVDSGAGTLRAIGRADSGGGGATHLSYDPRSRTVFVANYGTGHVAAIPVAADGALAPPSSVQADAGSGPHRRQRGPHAHSAVVDPSGRFVLVADLGADRLFVYRFDRAKRTLAPAAVPFAAFPPGSGPRHIAFSPDGRFVFVDTELTGEVHGFRWDARAGRLTPVARVAIDAADFAGTRSAAEIRVSGDGRFLYVSNRAANLIQAFAVDRTTGALAEIQRIDCGGQIPWSFAIDPSGRWLVVANQGSGNLATFAVDRATGRLTATASRLVVVKPVALAFVR
jgi:6-phosphogluconolactonase